MRCRPALIDSPMVACAYLLQAQRRRTGWLPIGSCGTGLFAIRAGAGSPRGAVIFLSVFHPVPALLTTCCLQFLVQEKPREEDEDEQAEEGKRAVLAAGVRDGGEDDDRVRVRPVAAAAAASSGNRSRNRNRCVSRSSLCSGAPRRS